MTKNHIQRHKQHTSNRTNNIMLSQFIAENGVKMSILHVCSTYEDMRQKEVDEIKARHNLLNMVHKDFTPQSVSKPWMAGTGVKCPTALAIRQLAIHGEDVSQFKKYRDGLSDIERAWYELRVASDLWEKMEGWRPNLIKWRDQVSDNMEQFLPILKKGHLYG